MTLQEDLWQVQSPFRFLGNTWWDRGPSSFYCWGKVKGIIPGYMASLWTVGARTPDSWPGLILLRQISFLTIGPRWPLETGPTLPEILYIWALSRGPVWSHVIAGHERELETRYSPWLKHGGQSCREQCADAGYASVGLDTPSNPALGLSAWWWTWIYSSALVTYVLNKPLKSALMKILISLRNKEQINI